MIYQILSSVIFQMSMGAGLQGICLRFYSPLSYPRAFDPVMELTDARRIMLEHNYTWYDLFYNTLQTPKMAICLNETTYHLKHNSVNRSFAFG